MTLSSPSAELSKEVLDFFGPNGRLSNVLSGFEFRKGQMDMAVEVLSALLEGRRLIVEAGTGTGKTLAYLIPILVSGKRAIVSTATKNLQEQIFDNDIPIIERAYRRPVGAVYLKGRRNYLCLRRFFNFQRQGTFKFKEEGLLFRIIETWVKKTGTGDRSEIAELPDDYAPWGEISSVPDSCLGAKCPHFDECFITRLRRNAQNSDLIVVNHHLFFSDLTVKERGGVGVIPRYEAAVLDEAHNLEDVATSYFGVTVSPFRVDEVIRDLFREAGYEKIEHKRLFDAARKLGEVSDNFFGRILEKVSGRGDTRTRIREGFFTSDDKKRAAALKDRLLILRDRVKDLDTDIESILSVARRCDEIRDDIDFIVNTSDRSSGDYVFWCEAKGRGVFLSATTIDVAGELERSLYKKVYTLIFTSATITVSGGFDFFQSNLGLDRDFSRDTKCLAIDGGFDMANQVLLYVPKHLPEPKSPGFVSAVSSVIEDAVRISRGRALILFTSIKNMTEVYQVLNGKLPMKVMIQGEAPRNVLLKRFREDIGSILLATSSFWEGVDVPGEALSLVIIDKLPFDSPQDPIIEAKMEYLRDRGQVPFLDYQLPRAVISLRQGLGRLIRSKRDRGVLGVLDSRLYKRNYGGVFFESLSDYPITDRIEDVEDFFCDIEETA